MNDLEKKIIELEGDIIDLKFDYDKSKYRENACFEMLVEINDSLNDLFKKESENERFNLGEVYDFRESLVSLKNSLRDFQKNYNIYL